MTNDEIKAALKNKSRIMYDGMMFHYAKAWRVSVSPRGEFISSLELISRRTRRDGPGTYETVVVAPAKDCEVAQ